MPFFGSEWSSAGNHVFNNSVLDEGNFSETAGKHYARMYDSESSQTTSLPVHQSLQFQELSQQLKQATSEVDIVDLLEKLRHYSQQQAKVLDSEPDLNLTTEPRVVEME